jgi:hypothetical protein
MIRRAMTCMALFILMFSASASAQDTTSTANLRPTAEGRLTQIVLRDGSSLYGRVLEVTATTLRFSSSIGETTIPRASVATIRQVDAKAIHDGQIWPEDPSRTRLFFAPTGRMLHKAETYFADAYIFFPSLQYGVSDRVSFGGGMSAFPGLGLDEQLYYVTPKVGVYSSPTVNVAVGLLAAGARSFSDETPVGLGYGVATFGDEDGSVTTGVGFGFARTRTSSAAAVMLGGSRRVSKSVALVSENYYFTAAGAVSLFSGGARFMSEHIAVDVALIGCASCGAVVAPYLAFIYRW